MRLFAADLATIGALRLPIQGAADILWATTSPDLYVLLVHERDWDPDRYRAWLADTWQRLLLH